MDPEIVLHAELPVSPTRIYDAFLDAEQHSAMTGASATSEPRIGGRFTAWDGYIEGTYVELVPGARIVARWRTSEFPEGSPDSRLEIQFAENGAGTKLTLIHSDIPDGQASSYLRGWEDYYFTPMREHFASA
jgi:uncharacterized protein YndB with AHSA1/START domain